MFAEDQLIPISALQHWAFCPRQCALIHLDRTWLEDARTAEGRILHDRTHGGGSQIADGLRTVRSLPLRSLRLGLAGIADVVEFHTPQSDTPNDQAAHVPAVAGRWTVLPIEYKRGRPKCNDCDRVQLCAQAICLEEMLDVHIPRGALYYGQRKRRTDVIFNSALRARTEYVARQVRRMFDQPALPPPKFSRKCRSCSLMEACMPQRTGRSHNIVRAYVKRMVAETLTDQPPKEIP